MTPTMRTRGAVAAALVLALTAAGCCVSPPSAPTAVKAPAVQASVVGAADASRCNLVRANALTNPPLYASSTSWNVPASCFPTRGDSAHWADNWFNFGNLPGRTDATQRGAIDLAFDDYSTPVYDVAEATETRQVFIADWGYGDPLLGEDALPWNPTWTPAGGSDAELIIVDRATGREWGMWGLQTVNWSSCLTPGNVLSGYRPGIDLCAAQASLAKTPTGEISDFRTSSGSTDGAGRGMGAIQGLALLPTLDEIERGSINHAVNMETYGTMFGPACTPAEMGTAAAGASCGFAVAPATRLEWSDGPAGPCGAVAQANTVEGRSQTVPEGMRFVLNLTDAQIDSWLDGQGYTGPKRTTARIFAVALRDYGWIISDTSCWGSSVSVDGVANPRSAQRWAALGIDQPAEAGGALLDGLITSAAQVRTLASPTPEPILNP